MPISLKKWICSFLAKSAAPILCTGASPHRYKSDMLTVAWIVEIDGANLVVETTLAIQVFEELHVSFTSPEVKVTDLEVAPDYE